MLSRAGLGLRTQARRWSGTGRVTVNGEKIQTPDVWIDPARDRVALDGRPRRVRRMVESLGPKVLKLVRARIGSVKIGNLEIGGPGKPGTAREFPP